MWDLSSIAKCGCSRVCGVLFPVELLTGFSTVSRQFASRGCTEASGVVCFRLMVVDRDSEHKM
jgi:hypothetical protein